ncbi:MAG: hypothetical protein ACI9H6_000550 [Patiriisocius sp.]|jgi:hypothetical protein
MYISKQKLIIYILAFALVGQTLAIGYYLNVRDTSYVQTAVESTAVGQQHEHDLLDGHDAVWIAQHAEADQAESLKAESDDVPTVTTLVIAETPTCADYVGMYVSDITDVSNNNHLQGSLEITVDDENCYFVTNQIPDHDIGAGSRFATEAGEVETTFTIPRNPVIANESTDKGSVSAVFLNGVKWDMGPAACFDEGTENLGQEKIGCNDQNHPWRYDVGSVHNGFGLDDYSAHVQPGGIYHYHAEPTIAENATCGEVIGFAGDGFPIYGSCYVDEQGVAQTVATSHRLRSGEREDEGSYLTPYKVGLVLGSTYNGQFSNDYEFVSGLGDLDECNGMERDGSYGYYVTGVFPYVVGCFTGTPLPATGPQGGGAGSVPQDGGTGGPPEGGPGPPPGGRP